MRICQHCKTENNEVTSRCWGCYEPLERSSPLDATACSAWTATSAALPQEIDAPYDLVWWWVPMVDEPVADWWDMPDDATHWMPWEPDMLPPPPPNTKISNG